VGKARPAGAMFDGLKREEEFARVADWRPGPLPSLDGVPEIKLDCETTGLRWHKGDLPVGFSVKRPGEPSRYYPFAHRSGSAQNLDEGQCREWARRELRGKRISNTNTRFDVHMMREWGADLVEQGCEFHDVSHATALIDDWHRDFTLNGQAKAYLDEGRRKLTGEDPRFRIEGKSIADYPPGMVAPYAERDTDLVAWLEEAQSPLLAEQDLNRIMALEDSVIPVVCEMERNGCPLDVELLDRWCAESQDELEETLWEVQRRTGLRVNPDSNDDLQKLFLCQRIPMTSFTDKGKPSFADSVMKRLAAENEVVALVRHAGKLVDLRSKYLVKYRDAVGSDGILRYALHQLMTGEGGTVSGRFASSSVNIQQVMAIEKQAREYGSDRYLVRRLFRPGSGFWLSVDAAQVEYRLFAHYANSRKILDVFGADPYADYHQVVTDLLRPIRPDFDRKRVKNVNFAQIFGAGLEKTAMMLETDMSEAMEFMEIYHRMFPEVRVLMKRAMGLAERRGFVKTLLGRRARFPQAKRLHSALNRAIQGTAADYNKMVIVEVFKARKQFGLTLRSTIHDEFNADMQDRGLLPDFQRFVDRQLMDVRVPILWACETGPNWGDLQKHKDLPRYERRAA
jgi:DNA polymerase I